MGPALQVIGLVVGFASYSAQQDAMGRAEEASLKAAESQKQAIAAQQEQQNLAARRERRQAVRQGIILRQRQAAQMEAAGVGQTSAAGGVRSSVSSQVGGNLGFGSQMSGLGQRFSQASMNAATFNAQAGIFQQQAQTAGQLSGAGFGMFSSFGGTNFGGPGTQSIFA
jgi:hypothetical protein